MENQEIQTAATCINMLALMVEVMNALGADQTSAVVGNELLVGEAQARCCASALMSAIEEKGV